MLGGRTAMMGGAGVARGSDGATAFINPAGLTRIPGESFSFQTVAIQLTSRSVPGQLDPGQNLGLRDPTSMDFGVRILPNTFCLFLDGPPKDGFSGRSRHKYGICAADVENENFYFSSNESGVAAGSVRTVSSHTTRMNFARSAVAGAWGFELMPGTSIGVSARIENTRFQDQTTASVLSTRGEAAEIQTITQARSSSSWDSAITIGMTHAISRVVTVGASLTTPALHFLGFHKGSESFSPIAGQPTTLVQDTGDFRYNQPAALRLGMAFFWPTLQIEVNGNFYGAQQVLAEAKFDRGETEVEVAGESLAGQTFSRGSLVEHGAPVTNLSIGVEKFIESDYSLIFGLLTDFSGLIARQEVRPANALFRQRKDAVHASFGVASYGTYGHVLLGLRGFFASGEVLMADASAPTPTFAVLPQTDFGLGLIVSGQISFEAVRDVAVRAAQPLTKIPEVIETKDDAEGDAR